MPGEGQIWDNVRDRLPRLLTVADRRQEPWRLTRLGSLFKGESQADEGWLTPGTSEERDSDRQTGDKSGSDVDIWVARDGGGIGASPGHVIAVDQVSDPRRTSGGRDHGVDALGPGKLMVLLDRVQISLLRQRTLGFGFQKQILPEIWHLFLPIAVVEIDNVF